MRTFATGATRNSDEGKHDFEGFLSPLFIERFAEYMTKHRVQADGTIRDSDNWQKGIPMEQYMKSLWRHFFDLWKLHRMSLQAPLTGEMEEQLEETMSAMYFNLQGYGHEHLKRKHGTWSYILLQEAAKESAEKEREELAYYQPDTRPVGEGEIRGDAYEPPNPPPMIVAGRNPNWWMDPVEEMHHELAPHE
jgi:hypothetical protein